MRSIKRTFIETLFYFIISHCTSIEQKRKTKGCNENTSESKSTKPLNTNNQSINEHKQKDNKEEIKGIISNHEDVIRYLISIYHQGSMGRNIKTSQVSLARFIAKAEILGYIVDGKYKPLNISSITNYISTIINEDRKVKKKAKE